MQRNNHNILESDRIGRILWNLSLPMLFGTFIQAIYSVVDTIFIGHYVGSQGLAALSVSFPLSMLAFGLGNLAGVGGASLISRLIGGGDKSGAERTLGNGITIAVVLSVVLTAIVLPNVTFWAKLIGASENVIPFARDYLTVMMAGSVFTVLVYALMIFVRSEGNARVSMTILILSSVLNIILDAVFIISLHMGVKGAALATVLSQVIAVSYAFYFYTSGKSYLRLHLHNFYTDIKTLKRIFEIGIGQFGQAIATSLAAMLIIKQAATYGGDLALSTFGIIQRVLYFMMMPGQVIGQGMQPVLGFNYGARRFTLALKSINLAILSATVLSVVIFVLFYVFTSPIINIFTSDPVLANAGIHVARRVFLVIPILGFFNVGQLVFPSIGKAVQSFIIAIARPTAFLIPMLLILPHFLELDGVWYAFPSADLLSFLLVAVLMIPLYKQFKKDAGEEKAAASQTIREETSVA
jgi:putative MATE family efflux protein